MPKKDTRSIKGHHLAFLAGCLLLVGSTTYAFLQDYVDRQYPQYQKQFLELEQVRLNKELAVIDEEMKGLQALREEKFDAYSAAWDVYKENIDNIDALKKKIAEVDDKLSIINRKLNFAGTDTGVYKWNYSQEDKTLEDVNEHIAHHLDLREETEKLVVQKNGLVKQMEELDTRAAALKELKATTTRIEALKRSIAKVEGNPALNAIKDLPGFDFIQPRFNLNDQIQLPNLPMDVKFAKTTRVERCVACHKAIANPDPQYADKNLDVVMRSHPRLDLFMASASAHPMGKFGCTICHQGRPMGTSFTRSGHTPQNAAQGLEWEEKHGWGMLNQHKAGFPLWDTPMLPLQYTEASCAKCHHGVDELKGANKLNHGKQLFREKGCTNCHIGTSDADYAWVGRIGPDLRRITEKTSFDWAQNWIANPWDYRPTTNMPRFFGLENRKDDKLHPVVFDEKGHKSVNGDEHNLRDPVEVEAVTTYLWAASKLREKDLPAPPAGDAASGEKLFNRVGCLACHSVRERDELKIHNHSDHGPDLSRIGDKVTAKWLFQWLKNPHEYWPESQMPSLRLNDQEAADLSAFLLTKMKSGDEVAAPDKTPVWAYDSLIRDLLQNATPDFQVNAMLADPDSTIREVLRRKVVYHVPPGEDKPVDTGKGEWTEEQIDAVIEALDEMGGDKLEATRLKKGFYAGQALIQSYGCYGCHNIQGWTYAPLTCVSLVGEGDKDVSKFDFGKASIPYTRWDWVYLKIARPRVFDIGKLDVTRVPDRLRMPWFGYQAKTHPDAHGSGHQGGHKDNDGHKHEHKDGEAHDHARLATEQQRAASGGGGGLPDLDALHNPDQGSPYGLSHEDVEALVTVVLSFTEEDVPVAMQQRLDARAAAEAHGTRVVKALNCIGCHPVGMSKPLATENPGLRGRIPLEALISADVQNKAKAYGLFATEDYVKLDDPKTGAEGYINFGRGTYLSNVTLRILLAELMVRPDENAPWQPAAAQLLNKTQYRRVKGDLKKETWVPYGMLVDFDTFKDLTRFFLSDAEAEKAYKDVADRMISKEAFERIAGTEVFNRAHLRGGQAGADGNPAERSPFYLGKLDLDQMRAEKKFYEPQYVEVRWTPTAEQMAEVRGRFESAGWNTQWLDDTASEGSMVQHMVEMLTGEKQDVSQQDGPPSLAFEGGKVQPDWFYRFLHHVQPLRPGLQIRMPSFWTESSHDAYKTVYRAGRQSKVDNLKRPTGVSGEPMSNGVADPYVADDALQIIEYFNAIGHEAPYGYQPVPVVAGEEALKKYAHGRTMLTSPDKGGLGCNKCHEIGKYRPANPVGPNLAISKRRFKDDWLRRFLMSPGSIYPWTNMPSNFYDWTNYDFNPEDPLRGLKSPEEFKQITENLKAAQLYLESSGEAGIGEGITE